MDPGLGGPGNDRVYGMAGTDVLRGGPGNDHLGGGADDDLVAGGPGDDFVGGSSGMDRVNGGPGGDELHGWTGEDVLSGNAGDDELRGERDPDVLRGGAGNDHLRSSERDSAVVDQFFGGPGNDRIVDLARLLAQTPMTAHGGPGNDFIRLLDVIVRAGAGDDLVILRNVPSAARAETGSRAGSARRAGSGLPPREHRARRTRRRPAHRLVRHPGAVRRSG